MQIISQVNFEFFRIKINDIIHISIKYNEIIGMQSWIENECKYCIEIQTKRKDIKYEYDSKEKWEKIITLFAENKII